MIYLISITSLNLLYDYLEYDSTLGELESNILASWCDLTELGNCVETLLGCYDYSPLAAILFLQELDQHICRIIGETFGSNRSNYVVFAEVLEVLICILRSLDPKRIVLRGLALVRYIAIQEPQTLLHCN